MSNLFDLSGKVAVVTGGARGLGRMMAQGLLEAGAKVYITSRKPSASEQAAAELSRFGACLAVSVDLSSPGAAEALARSVADREPRVDILINNAGRTWGASLESFPDSAWADVMAVNVQGPFAVIRALLQLLSAAGTSEDPARVINIGSLAGLHVEPIPAYSYAASKAALHHLSRVLAAELAPRHISVNTLVPGYFPTAITSHLRQSDEDFRKLCERIPLGRMGEPDDIAHGSVCLPLVTRRPIYHWR